ncbi:hypothetical protein [Nonomuraea typhae]|uniref:Uncharacterized protein n=1 Tax=Nonomuraea typhae TaxID=2603600 RepID=A0ABW7ZEC1_9ACTN
MPAQAPATAQQRQDPPGNGRYILQLTDGRTGEIQIDGPRATVTIGDQTLYGRTFPNPPAGITIFGEDFKLDLTDRAPQGGQLPYFRVEGWLADERVEGLAYHH